VTQWRRRRAAWNRHADARTNDGEGSGDVRELQARLFRIGPAFKQERILVRFYIVVQGRRSVLIVDDDDDLRRMFRTALSLAGFTVREAADGYLALGSIERDPPDLIVLDLGLPTLNGYVVLQELTSQAHTRSIPVVVITGQDRAAHADGMACLLQKPVTPDRLVNTVRGCLASGSRPAV